MVFYKSDIITTSTCILRQQLNFPKHALDTLVFLENSKQTYLRNNIPAVIFSNVSHRSTTFESKECDTNFKRSNNS